MESHTEADDAEKIRSALESTRRFSAIFFLVNVGAMLFVHHAAVARGEVYVKWLLVAPPLGMLSLGGAIDPRIIEWFRTDATGKRVPSGAGAPGWCKVATFGLVLYGFFISAYMLFAYLGPGSGAGAAH